MSCFEMNETNTHELKILPEYFEVVANGSKRFEIRKADRDFKVGDFLILREWNRGKFTGRSMTQKIEYIYKGDGSYGLSEEYCILGLHAPRPEMPFTELNLLQDKIIWLDLKYSETQDFFKLINKIREKISEAVKNDH